MNPATYYFIQSCINHTTTVEEVEVCEQMINTLMQPRYTTELADAALHQKVSIIAQQYPVTE